ncbi:dihydrofolate reductase [Serratia symbiotica str. 'Cinara cedri']|nr:dihydrofolate reductase [Serratia symbiotica str. 'Cinara cedri']
MIISLIAALSVEHVIGTGNVMPWHLPSDLIWFKCMTQNKPVIMGRKTFESIGYPLSNRHNIVLSSRSGSSSGGLTWVNSIDDALDLVKNVKEVMVIGGECIYSQFILRAKRMYLTYIYASVSGDIYFPEYKPWEWETIFSEFHNADALNYYSHCFKILERY